MALELVECPHCHYKFRTDIEALINDGTTIVERKFLSFGKPKSRTLTSIDLLCPHCKKPFDYKVKP